MNKYNEENFLKFSEEINKYNKIINDNFKNLKIINLTTQLLEYENDITDIKFLINKCNNQLKLMKQFDEKINKIYKNFNVKFMKINNIIKIINLEKIKQKLDERERDLIIREKNIKEKEEIFIKSIYEK
jgi:hypothetical protein